MASRAISKAVREVRLHLCQSGQGSAGARQYLLQNYAAIKSANPETPFLVREASGIPARVYARFERGLERSVDLEGASAADVEKRISQLLSS
ncbi:hypothetical protein CF319_g3717 [Tilletia indica]|uniref:Ribosomal protein/NADH dehydrogenase domain-containing protein n=1 Tax=Tilletia indica TaxID=43049 RepID=A0A177TS77_9BASI|nr:hypothetical protein CF319_g3717 [Tilletia indica]KAE8233451.1 hypothetical protein CF326_g1510 [Tilletia indica]KAE8259911.1 hypothetical protein A4X13_0g690 [Tilletia indica]